MDTSDDIVLTWCPGFQKRTACLPPVFWSNRTLAVSRARKPERSGGWRQSSSGERHRLPGALPTEPDVQVSLSRVLGSPQAVAPGSPNGRHPVWRITVLSQPLREVVHDPGLREWQPTRPSIDKRLPGDGACVAAPAPPVVPRTLGRLANDVAPLAVATYPRVWVLATPLQTAGLRRLLEWRMAVCTPPRPSPWQEPTQAFPARLPLDAPVSTAWRGPRVGQAEHVAGPRAPRRWVATWWPRERRPPRLGGMQAQAETGQPPREDFHHPAGVGFHLAAEETISGNTRSTAPAWPPGGPVCDTPCVHDPRQASLRPQGREHSALWRPLVRGRPCSRLQHARLEPRAHEPP